MAAGAIGWAPIPDRRNRSSGASGGVSPRELRDHDCEGGRVAEREGWFSPSMVATSVFGITVAG
ncbi:MAG TPA: hypothetical protein VFC16_05720 [Nakamurella sp.]|nr:hypothetical protein [Nakamurella sp.]